MKLRDYLSANGLSASAFAGMVGTAQPTISRILNGKRRPSPSMAREIERITGGKVRRHELRPDLWDAPKRRAAA